MIEKEIDKIMDIVNNLVILTQTKKDLNALEKHEIQSTLILIKELHLCVIRNSYRIDLARNNFEFYDNINVI
jgi:hypothetical protein